jgi:hypothetical protein
MTQESLTIEGHNIEEVLPREVLPQESTVLSEYKAIPTGKPLEDVATATIAGMSLSQRRSRCLAPEEVTTESVAMCTWLWQWKRQWNNTSVTKAPHMLGPSQHEVGDLQRSLGPCMRVNGHHMGKIEVKWDGEYKEDIRIEPRIGREVMVPEPQLPAAVALRPSSQRAASKVRIQTPRCKGND